MIFILTIQFYIINKIIKSMIKLIFYKSATLLNWVVTWTKKMNTKIL